MQKTELWPRLLEKCNKLLASSYCSNIFASEKLPLIGPIQADVNMWRHMKRVYCEMDHCDALSNAMALNLWSFKIILSIL